MKKVTAIQKGLYWHLLIFFFVSVFDISLFSQSPGGVSAGLRTWYKADAVTGFTNGQDMSSWSDQATADGIQNAVQNGKNVIPSIFGNRQPQFRTPVSRYNFNPYIDFTKQFSSFIAYQAHSARPDYQYNYVNGATLYQVGDLSNNQGWFLGTGLGATTGPIAGTRYEYGYPWWGLNQQYYGTACGYYYSTVDDYGWYTYPFPPYRYNYARPERKTQNTIPWINSVSFDKYGTYKTCCVVGTDANTAMQTRVNGDKWSWGYAYTPMGPSLFIGNELTNYNAGRWWQGGIPEVILYNRKLNTAVGDEADRVDSYLALKYGITLYHSYYLSNGTIVWDTMCNNRFNNEIAGLVKDNTSALNVKQSHSVLKKSVITMSLGNLIENDNSANTSVIPEKYSMVWGSTISGGSIWDSKQVPGGFGAIPSPPGCLNATNVSWTLKKWQVQEQSGKDIGTVKVYVESKDLSCLDWSCQAYIVVGTNPTFSNPVYYPLTLATGTTGSTSDYVADVNFCEGAANSSTVCGGLKTQFFAIVGKGGEYYPGGVSRNLVYWTRADLGTINDTTLKTPSIPNVKSRVREWMNITRGPNALAYNFGDPPTLRPPTRYDNFNPIVSFCNLGLTVAGGGENYDPQDATMVAKGVLGNANGDYPSLTVADSLSMFSSHRNLIDWYNGTIGMGSGSVFPGLFHDWTIRNGVEFDEANTSWNTGTANTYTTPYAGVANVQLYGPSTYYPDSKFGRTYQSAAFWYPHLTTGIVPGVTQSSEEIRGNGKQLATRNMTAYNLSQWNNLYHRGNVNLAGGDYADYGGGAIHDVILYKGGFIAADFELERIETYLGIRSGITMRHNYYATDKTLIWDTTAITDAFPNNPVGTTRYNASITGIGRDDIEALHQRCSRNAEDTTVTISLGVIPADEDQTSVDRDFQNNKEYIIWGSNGAATNTRYTQDLPSSLPGCIDSRLHREYHIHLNGTNTGTYGTQVRWQLKDNTLDTVSATNISLLIDDDGDGSFNTGPIRAINATSYNVASNTVIFDNVTWSATGDPDADDAAMTIGWGQNVIGKVKLYNNTPGGGGNCTCGGASEVVNPICTDAAGWTYYQDNDNNRKVVAIAWGANSVSATVTADASSSAASRRKSNLNIQSGPSYYDSAAVVGARMINVTLNSGSITSPVKLRFYYDPVEIQSDSTWIISSSGVGNGGGVAKPYLQDSTWTWFKFEGNVSGVINNLSASGLPKATDLGGPNNNKMITLIPDEKGIEDGIPYVQFNYLTGFSTFGYIQTFVKNNDVSQLPLTLLGFDVMLSGNTTHLTWSTSLESQVSHFEIERSLDNGNSFHRINDLIPAYNFSGQTNFYHDYDHLDQLKGTIYYRLKVVDQDGSSVYSPLRSVRVEGAFTPMQIIPNPFSESFDLVLSSSSNEQITVNIVSVEGKVEQQFQYFLLPQSNTFTCDMSNLKNGTYFIEVVHESGQVERTKIVKL